MALCRTMMDRSMWAESGRRTYPYASMSSFVFACVTGGVGWASERCVAGCRKSTPFSEGWLLDARQVGDVLACARACRGRVRAWRRSRSRAARQHTFVGSGDLIFPGNSSQRSPLETPTTVAWAPSGVWRIEE
eukprot:scaffold8888_cov115-Isochrysis_galbana.AAC.5